MWDTFVILAQTTFFNHQLILKFEIPNKIFYFRKCPYREPRLYCSVAPGKVTGLSLAGAEDLGKEVAKCLVDKNALEIMLNARNEVLKPTKW